MDRAFVPVVLIALCALSACVTMTPLVKADGSPDGEAIFQHRCNQCHALPDPGAYSDREWARLVKRYGPRAGIRPEWRTAVIAWLQEVNDQPRPDGSDAK